MFAKIRQNHHKHHRRPLLFILEKETKGLVPQAFTFKVASCFSECKTPLLSFCRNTKKDKIITSTITSSLKEKQKDLFCRLSRSKWQAVFQNAQLLCTSPPAGKYHLSKRRTKENILAHLQMHNPECVSPLFFPILTISNSLRRVDLKLLMLPESQLGRERRSALRKKGIMSSSWLKFVSLDHKNVGSENVALQLNHGSDDETWCGNLESGMVVLE